MPDDASAVWAREMAATELKGDREMADDVVRTANCCHDPDDCLRCGEQRETIVAMLQAVRVATLTAHGEAIRAERDAWRNKAIDTNEKLSFAELTLANVEAERDAIRAEKDAAYRERNMLVAALSKCFPSALSRHPETDATWEDDWRWIVFVDLPTGQASWHIHDSELSLFDHLPREERTWDGHTTAEKYARLAAMERDARKHSVRCALDPHRAGVTP